MNPADNKLANKEHLTYDRDQFQQSQPLFIAPTSGIKTTEFWLTMFLNILAVGVIFVDSTNAPWAIVASAIVTTVYNTLRGALKHGYNQKASQLQKMGGQVGALLIACFLLAGSGLLTSCGGTAGDAVSWADDDFDLTVSREDGIFYYLYDHHESGRKFRASQGSEGWAVETLEPTTGLWIGYNDAKGGMTLESAAFRFPIEQLPTQQPAI